AYTTLFRSLAEVREVETRGEHDEQDRDEEQGEAFLEVEDVVDVDLAHVGERHPHHRDGEQARLVRELVRHGEARQDEGERHHVAQVPGDEMPAQQERQRERRRQAARSEEHTSELQSRENLVCRLLLEKKKDK